MPMLSQMFRSMAITGDATTWRSRIAGRQAGRWAQQTVSAAVPHHPHGVGGPPRGPGPATPRQAQDRLAGLADLHARGVIDDAEYQQLRRMLRL